MEYLPPAEAEPLVRAWHSVTTDIDPDRQAVWATLALREPDVVTLADQLAHPQVCGLQVPATAMLEPSCLESLAPVLAVAERAGLPVMVHPGPAGPAAAAVPAWWPATVSYSAQLAAAWFAWLATGRQLLPSLRIVFVALAGLAPLHHERLSQRGGPLSRIDPLVFYETSSYGAQAIDAMTRVVGVDTLVSGSDRPYAERADSGLGRAFDHSCDVVNPRRLLNGDQR